MKIFCANIQSLRRAVKILTVVNVLTGCSGPSYRAPVVDLEQPPTLKIQHHTVATGETLYSIAWRYNLNTVELARNNRIAAPYIIQPGQVLSLDLSQPPLMIEVETAPPNPVKTRSRSQPRPAPEHTIVAPQNAQLRWNWPANGTILAKFSGPQALNTGIDISGKKGEPVLAAESGTVVYAGSGLRGYGKLIIVKHNENYLSAYAHNDQLLVTEQDSVKAGQKIAEIGSTGTDRVKLHFEIRLNGKPVDPLDYLPKR